MSKSNPTPLGATLVRKGGPVMPSVASASAPEAPPVAGRPPKLGTIAVTVRLDPDRYERLKAESTALRRTNQDIIVEALDARWMRS